MSDSSNIIPLHQLSLSQLNGLKDQLEKELDLFTTSYQQLKMAQQRFIQCCTSLEELGSKDEDREILVPLTSSVYAPGKLAQTNHVLVDIGTGYYVTKHVSEAAVYFKGKIHYLKEQLDQLQKNIYVKQDSLLTIMGEMQLKMAQQQQQAAAQH